MYSLTLKEGAGLQQGKKTPNEHSEKSFLNETSRQFVILDSEDEC